MREVLRQEKKYLLAYEQFRKLDSLFEKVLTPDPHNGSTGYMVRSLYFDTLDNRDFYEKEDGLEIRRKIRLRVYSPDAQTALLEIKQKQGQYQKKRSLVMEREDAELLAQGNYGVLMKYEETFAKECYGLMNIMCYRPVSIVEYRRKAYIAKENKTRITLDFQIAATESRMNLFSGKLNMNPVFDQYLSVLEVKYSGFLMSYIKDIISSEGKTPLSVSKYSLSRSTGLHYFYM